MCLWLCFVCLLFKKNYSTAWLPFWKDSDLIQIKSKNASEWIAVVSVGGRGQRLRPQLESWESGLSTTSVQHTTIQSWFENQNWLDYLTKIPNLTPCFNASKHFFAFYGLRFLYFSNLLLIQCCAQKEAMIYLSDSMDAAQMTSTGHYIICTSFVKAFLLFPKNRCLNWKMTHWGGEVWTELVQNC